MLKDMWWRAGRAWAAIAGPGKEETLGLLTAALRRESDSLALTYADGYTHGWIDCSDHWLREIEGKVGEPLPAREVDLGALGKGRQN